MDSYVLITGASSGIGLELARVFAQHQRHLILVARSTSALQSLAAELQASYKIRAEVVSLDLAQASAPQELFQICQSKNWAVDILVNNAGVGDNVAFKDSQWPRQEMMVDLNIKSLVHLTHLFLPAMLKSKKGAILNVASTAAFQPGPYMAVYYATKSFVLSFSEAINEELRETGVHITALCPGPTRSGFQKAAGMGSNLLMNSPFIPSSADVAKYGYEALMSKKPVAIHGLLNKAGAFSTRFTPKIILLKMVSKLQRSRLQS